MGSESWSFVEKMRLGSSLCATDSAIAISFATVSARSIFIIAPVTAFAVTA